MDVRSAQRVLLAAGYYKGGVDGIAGPKTREAVDKLINKYAGTDRLPMAAARWPEHRKMVAAVQIVLDFAGHSPGVADGLAGHNTMNALREWDHMQATGSPEVIPKVPTSPKPSQSPFPLQKDCPTFYGTPGPAIEKNLVIIETKFMMRLDYDLKTKTRKIRLHKKCADSADAAMDDILEHYGEKRLVELGLDRFAGSYMHRKMRGSNTWSMHAYGCAIDFYAGQNGLTTRCPDALFCGKNYDAFFDIWESHGWVSLGREIGRDWMHVQAARLK